MFAERGQFGGFRMRPGATEHPFFESIPPSGRRPGFSDLPTIQRAQIITAGMTLAPIMAAAASAQLTRAGTFFTQLFGQQGQGMQARAVEDLTSFTKGEPINNPGLIEAYQNVPEIMAPILARVGEQTMAQPLVPEKLPFTPDPGFIEEGEIASIQEQVAAQIAARIGDMIEAGVLDREQIMRQLNEDFAGIDPVFTVDFATIVDPMLAGAEGSEFAESTSAHTDATNPQEAKLNAFITAALKEKKLNKKIDAAFKLRVGQKAFLESQIESEPDYMLASIQSRRQALFQRPAAKLPMQMRDDGLVNIPYYSRDVQQ